MFGYIKPSRAELRLRDWDLYRGVYCGVCRQLGKRFGPPARLILSYDSAFLAMLTASLGAQPPKLCARRCKLHPWRRDPCCLPDPSLDFAAAVALLLFYQKLLDDQADGGFFQKARSGLLRRVFSRAYKKAAAQAPEAEKVCREFSRMQRQAEAGKDSPWISTPIPPPGPLASCSPSARETPSPARTGSSGSWATIWAGGCISPTPPTTWKRPARRRL